MGLKVSLWPSLCPACEQQEQISSMTALLSGNFLSERSPLVCVVKIKAKLLPTEGMTQEKQKNGSPRLMKCGGECQLRP